MKSKPISFNSLPSEMPKTACRHSVPAVSTISTSKTWFRCQKKNTNEKMILMSISILILVFL